MSKLREQRYPNLTKVLAVAGLTVRSAFRYRLVTFLIPILLGILIGMPYLIKHNGTAEMLTQVVLSYSMGVIIFLLGLMTVWLSCGSLAKEIQECQMQMLVVKPIARWQIWLGKWLGITGLNACLLTLSGAIVLGLLHSEAKSLSPEQRDALMERVLVSRIGLKEPPPDLSADVERIYQERLQQANVAEMDREYVRTKVEEEVWALNQIVKPQHLRRWEIDFGRRQHVANERPLHLRIKFYAAQSSSTGSYRTLWIVGDPARGLFWREELDLNPTAFHEIAIPRGLISPDGILRVECRNYTAASLIFPVEEDLTVLVRDGSFLLNYGRALAVILLWLALLAVFGLSAASILSFPVASFVVLALLIMVSSGNLAESVVLEGTVSGVDDETGDPAFTHFDWIMVPVFDVLLRIIDAVQAISPVEALAAGRSIPLEELFKVVLQLSCFLGLPVAGIGMYLFHRNELAISGKNG